MFIFILLFGALIPMSYMPEWISEISNPHKGYDLVQHVVFFGLLFFALWRHFSRGEFSPILCVKLAFVSLFIGVLLEILQTFTGRSGSMLDLAANALGIFLAFCVVYFRYSKKNLDETRS